MRKLLFIIIIGFAMTAQSMNYYFMKGDKGFITKTTIEDFLTENKVHSYFKNGYMLCGNTGSFELEIKKIPADIIKKFSSISIDKKKPIILIISTKTANSFSSHKNKVTVEKLVGFDFHIYELKTKKTFKIGDGELNEVDDSPNIRSEKNQKIINAYFENH